MMEEIRFIEFEEMYYIITLERDNEVAFYKFGGTNFEFSLSIEELNNKFDVDFTISSFKNAVKNIHHKVLIDIIDLLEKYSGTHPFNEQKIQIPILELFGFQFRKPTSELLRDRDFMFDLEEEIIVLRLFHLGQEVVSYAFKESFLNVFFHVDDFNVELDFLLRLDDDVLAEKINEYFNVGFYHVNREKLATQLQAYGRRRKVDRLL